jgi:Na+-transporting methylmalonyl-CoA/oxaloacetate decarboxylase gamma subunit
MKVELNSVFLVLSILAIILGGISWVLSKFLTDKKDKMTLAFEIEKIKEMISGLKEDVSKVETIQRELDIIKEQIKHL